MATGISGGSSTLNTRSIGSEDKEESPMVSTTCKVRLSSPKYPVSGVYVKTRFDSLISP